MAGRSLKAILDEANANRIFSAARDAKLGTILNLTPKFGTFTVASNVATLPNNAKCAAILRAYSTAGTLTGYLNPTNLATPTTGLIGISATGNLLFAAADAVTACQVVYISHEGEVVEETVPVVSNSATLLAGKQAFLLLAATSLAGTLTGNFAVQARAATPTTGQVALGVTGKTVTFAAADAVTSALVRYIRYPDAPVSSALLTEDKFY